MRPVLSRYLAYYPAYFLTGQRVREYRRAFEGTQWLPEDALRSYQWERLKRRLQLAYDSIPYYRDRFDEEGVRPGDVASFEDLTAVPSLTKEEIAANADRLLPRFRKERIFPRQTSGSSGMPLRLLKDATALAAMDAVMHRNYGWYGIEVGHRQARFWGSPLGWMGRTVMNAKDFALNRIRFSPFDLSEGAYTRFIRKMREFRPDFVYGYGQTIYRFAEFVAGQSVDLSFLRLRAAIVTGEMIFDDQIRLIGDALNCRVSNEYGCTETGIIAMTCPEGGMHLMADNLVVEFVRNGRHASPGEDGEIHVTELLGDAMPLVRYRLGDRGRPGRGSCVCGRGLPLLAGISGRIDDFIRCPSGRMADPIVFEYVLQELPSGLGQVTQFRITQESLDRLDVEVCYRGDRLERMIEAVTVRMKRIVGDGMEIRFRPVDAIPAEPSGKLRCFVSRIHP